MFAILVAGTCPANFAAAIMKGRYGEARCSAASPFEGSQRAEYVDPRRQVCCPTQSAENGFSPRASETFGPCLPSKIASRMSGASRVSRRTRVI